MKQIVTWSLLLAMAVAGVPVVAEEAPAEPAPAEAAPPAEEGPNVDAVLEELGKLGPEALAARVKAIQDEIGKLTTDAENLRKKAGELDAQSNALKARIAAIEGLMKAVGAAQQPAPEPPAEAPPAEPAPAPEAPAEAPAEG